MEATKIDVLNLQNNLSGTAHNLQSNQNGLQEQIISLNNRIRNLELKLTQKFKLNENDEFKLDEYHYNVFVDTNPPSLSNIIKIDKIKNQINDEERQHFQGQLIYPWNPSRSENIYGVYDIESNVGKIVESDNYETEGEIGYIDFKLNSDKTMNVIAYSDKNRYCYTAKYKYKQ